VGETVIPAGYRHAYGVDPATAPPDARPAAPVNLRVLGL
jgi:hypothetical protein